MFHTEAICQKGMVLPENLFNYKKSTRGDFPLRGNSVCILFIAL